MRKIYIAAALFCAIAAGCYVARRDVDGIRYETEMIFLLLILAKLEEK